ncbi:MAG: hypoxanthine phosphoribosyltransferase [Candidatus Saganbacteria bacterium]|nr:hypoxanthine phosphoribosyltransferase [Candidatus Saganbacteria bacterium]
MEKKRKIKILFKREKIKKRVRALAKKISKDYAERPLVLVGILKGSFIFLADLIRELTIPVEVDFVQISSYGGKMFSEGDLIIKKKIDLDVENKNVLVVEDIVDTGHTMSFFLEELKKHSPISVAVCALLEKPIRRKIPVPLKYVGFKIPDKFVVGYGLDFSEQHRYLPYIGEITG